MELRSTISPYLTLAISTHTHTPRVRSLGQNGIYQQRKPLPLPKLRTPHDAELAASELTAFRGLLGGMLRLCQTRLGLICDVALLQPTVCTATIKGLIMACPSSHVLKNTLASVAYVPGVETAIDAGGSFSVFSRHSRQFVRVGRHH